MNLSRSLAIWPLALVGIVVGTTVVSCADDTAEPTATTAVMETGTDPGIDTGAGTTTIPPTPTTTLGPYVSPLGDIVGEALYAGSFTTLAGLLVRAGLVQAIRATGPFTVFAPTDDAFATLPADTLDAVMADPDLLAAVLTYHVVAGEFSMADARDGDTLTTLQGGTLTITKRGDTTLVNGIELVATDIPATNGSINVLSAGVLVPEG